MRTETQEKGHQQLRQPGDQGVGVLVKGMSHTTDVPRQD